MTRHKLIRYQQNTSLNHLIQSDTSNYKHYGYLYGRRWSQYFGNDHPIVLELGCGQAEHSVYGAIHYPHINWIGIDIKWDRLRHAAKIAHEKHLNNLALLRLNIHTLSLRFMPWEVAEILIPYPDPRPLDRDTKRRLTYPRFLSIYYNVLSIWWCIKCKTDDQDFFSYTCKVAQESGRILQMDSHSWILSEFPEIISQFSLKKWKGQTCIYMRP